MEPRREREVPLAEGTRRERDGRGEGPRGERPDEQRQEGREADGGDEPRGERGGPRRERAPTPPHPRAHAEPGREEERRARGDGRPARRGDGGAGVEDARAEARPVALGPRRRRERRRDGLGAREPLADEQRRCARHVGRRHARAVEDAELLALVLAGLAHRLLDDGDAGRGDRELGPARGEPREAVVPVRRAHGDDPGVGRRVADAPSAVARGGDDDDALREGVLHGVVHRQARERAAEAQVHHLRAVVGGEADALGDVRHGSEALPAQHLHGHERRAGREAGDALPVVGGLRDRAGDVRPVPVVVGGDGVLPGEVPPRDAARAREIAHAREGRLVVAGDTRVDDGDGDARAAGEVPRPLGAHPREVPLILEARIVGREERARHDVALDGLDARIRGEPRDGLGLAGGVDVREVHLAVVPDLRAVVVERSAEQPREVGDVRGGDVVAEVDGELARDVVGPGRGRDVHREDRRQERRGGGGVVRRVGRGGARERERGDGGERGERDRHATGGAGARAGEQRGEVPGIAHGHRVGRINAPSGLNPSTPCARTPRKSWGARPPQGRYFAGDAPASALKRCSGPGG